MRLRSCRWVRIGEEGARPSRPEGPYQGEELEVKSVSWETGKLVMCVTVAGEGSK